MSLTSILLVVIGVGVCLILSFVLPVVMYQSLYKIGADEKVVFYYWGTYSHIRVNATYFDVMWEAQSDVRAKVEACDQDKVKAGWWNGGWAFGLWPLYLGYKIPTDQFDVPIHASQAYTSSTDKDLPRVRIEIDATLQFRLSDNPIFLGMVFPLFSQTLEDYFSKARRDLTNSDQLIIDGEGEASKTHRVKKIALLFYNVINRPMLEAVRTAATKFTFSTMPIDSAEPADDDIVQNRKKYERAVMEVLAEDKDTVFCQARLLEEGGKKGETGTSLLVCNFVGENVQLSPKRDQDSDATRAIDFSFIGRQEGLRQQLLEKLRRYGEAQGIEELAKRLGLESDKQRAFLMDMLRSRKGNLNFTSIDVTDVKDFLTAIQSQLDGSNQ